MTINQSLTYPNWLNNVLNVQKFPISKLTPVIVVFLLLVGYGAWIGSEQNQRGVSLFEVAYTYNAMNPISRIGYTFMLKRNHALVERAGEVKKSIDSMSGE